MPAAGGGGGGGNPYEDYANTALLVHFDSGDSAVGQDFSSHTHTPGYSGSPTTSATPALTNFEYCAAVSNGNWVNYPDDAAFSVGDGAWCAEFWVNWASTGVPVATSLLSQGGGTTSMGILLDNGSPQIRFQLGGADIITGGSFSTNTWYHVAVNFDGGAGAAGRYTAFVDGTVIGTATSASRWTDDNNGVVLLAATTTQYFNEVRIVVGNAIYPTDGTTGFTPQDTPFANS
jgi:hypothetical protein